MWLSEPRRNTAEFAPGNFERNRAMPQLSLSARRLPIACLIFALHASCSLVLEGCGGGIAPNFNSRLSVEVSPSIVAVPFGWTEQFSAAISGNPATNVTWTVNGIVGGNPSTGTISASGLYTAPAVPPATATVSISAASMADSNVTGLASVNLVGLFAYVTNQSDGTINGYGINATGLLVPLANTLTTTGQKPFFLESTPDGKFMYVTDLDSSAVYAYSIDPVSGTLTQAGQPTTVGSGPRGLAVHPTGKYLYVACTDGLGTYGFSIDANTGNLTALPGSPFPNAGLREAAIALDPSGEFAFVPNNASSNVSVFAVNSTNGQLTAVGPPFAAGGAPEWAVSDASGKYVYVLDDLDNSINAYGVASTGILSPLAPPTIGGVSNPFSATVSPTGKFLYVTNWTAASVSVFSIDPTSGNLAAIGGSPFGTGVLPTSFAFEPSGTYAYVANQAPQTIWGFSVNKMTGAPTQLPWAITAGKVPTSITVATTHP